MDVARVSCVLLWHELEITGASLNAWMECVDAESSLSKMSFSFDVMEPYIEIDDISVVVLVSGEVSI